jgi:hypothetical protein
VKNDSCTATIAAGIVGTHVSREEITPCGELRLCLRVLSILLSLAAPAQEGRSEISLQGTRCFTKDSSGQGVSRTTTDTGGFQVGYRYNINRWLAAEGNYGFERNTQKYFGSFGESRVQANVHAVTGDVVVKLPLPIRRISTSTI